MTREELHGYRVTVNGPCGECRVRLSVTRTHLYESDGEPAKLVDSTTSVPDVGDKCSYTRVHYFKWTIYAFRPTVFVVEVEAPKGVPVDVDMFGSDGMRSKVVRRNAP